MTRGGTFDFCKFHLHHRRCRCENASGRGAQKVRRRALALHEGSRRSEAAMKDARYKPPRQSGEKAHSKIAARVSVELPVFGTISWIMSWQPKLSESATHPQLISECSKPKQSFGAFFASCSAISGLISTSPVPSARPAGYSDSCRNPDLTNEPRACSKRLKLQQPTAQAYKERERTASGFHGWQR